jgi:glycerol-3-phosphate dehydrogenase (NAD(P)+)
MAGAAVVLAVPSQSLRTLTIGSCRPTRRGRLAKGIELGTCLRMSEVIAEVGGVPPERLAGHRA